jgi:hypothetical protein
MEEIYLWNSEEGGHCHFILQVLRGPIKNVSLAMRGVRWFINMEQITIKTPNLKCRLNNWCRAYRLEIQSVVLVFATPSCELAPL